MKNVGEMGLTQWSELSVALQKAGFTPEMMQNIIASKNNMLAERLYAAMKGLNTYQASPNWTTEEAFKIVKEFWITIPSFYDKSTWLFGYFFEKYKKGNYDESRISIKRYPSPTHDIVAGKTYKVEIVMFSKKEDKMCPQDCLDIFKQKKALLFGFHGLSLVHYLKKDKFKDANTIVCPDEKKYFSHEDPSDIPVLVYHPNERASLRLVPFDKPLPHYTTFLLFYEN